MQTVLRSTAGHCQKLGISYCDNIASMTHFGVVSLNFNTSGYHVIVVCNNNLLSPLKLNGSDATCCHGKSGNGVGTRGSGWGDNSLTQVGQL